MTSPRVLLVLAAGLVGPGCAARTRPAVSIEELGRTVNSLRAQNAAYTRQIEELQNRIFILQDRLDSRKVDSEREATPRFPVVKLQPPDGDAPGAEPVEYPGSPDVEYVGDAATSSTSRPVLRLSGNEAPPPRDAVEPAPQPRRRAPKTMAVAGEISSGYGREASKPAPAASAGTPFRPGPPPSELGPVGSGVKGRSLPPAAVAAALPGPKRSAAPPAPAVATAVARAPADPASLYLRSMELLKGRRHAEAVAGFREFVTRHPRHDYADNAQYWLGECFYDLKDHRAAVREFRTVVEQFPQGNKVPDALLKAGYAYLALGEVSAGRDALTEVIRSFPRHEASRLGEAKLKELEGRGVGAEAPAPAGPAPGSR